MLKASFVARLAASAVLCAWGAIGASGVANAEQPLASALTQGKAIIVQDDLDDTYQKLD